MIKRVLESSGSRTFFCFWRLGEGKHKYLVRACNFLYYFVSLYKIGCTSAKISSKLGFFAFGLHYLC